MADLIIWDTRSGAVLTKIRTAFLLQMLQTVVPPEAAANGAGGPARLDRQRLLYCERFVELLIDLLSQLPTRRFVRTLLEDKAILIKARMSPLFTHPEGESPMQPVCPVIAM